MEDYFGSSQNSTSFLRDQSMHENLKFNHRCTIDAQWSETGNRYLLKLFRDYVFHQVDGEGKPVLNMAHVLRCLNKLDVSSPERVLLTSRNGQNCLVVSYQDLRKCLEEAFRELVVSSKPK